ncbi:MFS transporter [Dysosmobacter sp. Marseille-Q4140]|nr:MFS transporter [Dysosmobacter sp. Marseille-Q4140]
MKTRKYVLIAVMTLSTLCYTYPYLSSTFYTQFMEAFGLTNAQVGNLIAMFGLTAVPGYLFGGLLADRFSPKKLVIISQLLTAVIGLCICFLQGYTILLICYLALGVSTTFIHWSAFLKLIRAQGTDADEGKIFGFFETCSAAVSIICSYGILGILGNLPSFRIVQAIYAVILIIVAVVIGLFVKDADVRGVSSDRFRISMAGKALRHPVTWINGFIVMGLFMALSCSTYLNPMLSENYGMNVTVATGYSIYNRYVARVLLATAGGLLLDKLKTPKFLSIFSVAMMVVLGGLIAVPMDSSLMVLAFILCILFSSMLGSTRSGMYTPIPEAKMPMSITGTAMGICSAIGYSSDLWLYTLCGKWLDQYGSAGYHYIWMLTIGAMALVVVCCVLLHLYEKKYVKA